MLVAMADARDVSLFSSVLASRARAVSLCHGFVSALLRSWQLHGQCEENVMLEVSYLYNQEKYVCITHATLRLLEK